jgi:hypothetical protein
MSIADNSEHYYEQKNADQKQKCRFPLAAKSFSVSDLSDSLSAEDVLHSLGDHLAPPGWVGPLSNLTLSLRLHLPTKAESYMWHINDGPHTQIPFVSAATDIYLKDFGLARVVRALA